jgi:signal transduction histidine kinase/ActR/RegA family two-component response regulator
LLTANDSGSRLFARFAAVNRAITTSLDFEELLNLVVRNARELVGADAALLLLAGEDEVLRVRAAEGVEAERFCGFSERMHESTVERVRTLLRPIGDGGFMALPVMVDRSVSGLLAVARDGPFEAEEQWVLSALADQAAIALRNAKLHEMDIERGRAEALERLAEESVRLLTSEPHKRTYDDLLATICRITDAPRGVFWLLDAAAPGEEFLFAASTCGFRRQPRDEFDRYALENLRRLPVSSNVPSARAARLLEVVSEPDLGRHTAGGTSRLFRQMQIRSVLAVPVRARDRLFGVVTLLWPEVGASEKPGRRHNAEVIVSQVSAALDVSGLVAELTQANRLKDEFLATLSHELRNPLNVITGYSELLLRLPEARSSAKIQTAAAAIARSASAQNRLVSDLLDLSRLQMGKLSLELQPLSLSAAIADAAEAVRADAAAKSIELQISLPDEPLLGRADPTRVQQIAWNLLSNAVKFTPAGGRVRLVLSHAGSEARLVVEDTGEGIDPPFLPRVFEVFRQAEGGTVRRHGGMGIGLALVRQLTELHGGKVEAFSAGVGRGAAFTVTLPLRETAGPETGAGRRVEASPSISAVRVLVVDDSRETVAALRDLLECEGARVTTALSGAEGLQIAKEEEFDVVISDVSMPEMDGYQFLQKLRSEAKRPPLTAVALTGFGRAEDVLEARHAGFDRHLTKPVNFEELLQVIRTAMDARRSPTPERLPKSDGQRLAVPAPRS